MSPTVFKIDLLSDLFGGNYGDLAATRDAGYGMAAGNSAGNGAASLFSASRTTDTSRKNQSPAKVQLKSAVGVAARKLQTVEDYEKIPLEQRRYAMDVTCHKCGGRV